jgi:hypothetical protein
VIGDNMQVKIINGFYGNKKIHNKIFKLAKAGIHNSKKGPFVLVNGSNQTGFPDRNFRISIKSKNDAEFEDLSEGEFSKPIAKTNKDQIKIETDHSIKTRLKERFQVLIDMNKHAISGAVRGLIVSGPPGVGKSFEVEQTLRNTMVIGKLSSKTNVVSRYKMVSGHITSAGLYELLYDYSHKGDVIVLDDCDRVWRDETSLNLLKAALDSSNARTISWMISDMKRNNEIPKSFNYEGSLIVISNLNFEKEIKNRSNLSMHFEAVLDRCFYLDMTIDTIREKLLRIEQVAVDFGMLANKQLTPRQSSEIMAFVKDKAPEFRNLSLRQVSKIADLYKISKDWKRQAELTILKQN